jgi:hypothetical protein
VCGGAKFNKKYTRSAPQYQCATGKFLNFEFFAAEKGLMTHRSYGTVD